MGVARSLDNYFSLTSNKTSFRIEFMAGVTTFMTMAYILVVNPGILAATGMDQGALFTATALSAIIATLVMALYAKLPFALAPGMGPNAFFAFTVVQLMGYSWQTALTIVFVQGIIFLVLTFLKVREAIVNALPMVVKQAMSAGIGLFIAFLGLFNSGIVVSGMFVGDTGDLEGVPVAIGDIAAGSGLLAVIGIVITGLLVAKGVKGSLLLGILITTALGIPLGVTQLPQGIQILSMPPSLGPIWLQFDFSQIFSLDILVLLFIFLFVDLFNTLGTLVGVATKAKMLDKDGNVPRVKEALVADAVGTTVGAMLGTSTVTTYVESAAGVAAGGKTGLTALSTAFMFCIALFLFPVFVMIPAAATAPVLVIVGLFMLSPIKDIDFSDYTEAIPAFLTIIMMPLTYSISEGIVFGMASFVFLKLLAGKLKDVTPLMLVFVLLFIVRIIIG